MGLNYLKNHCGNGLCLCAGGDSGITSNSICSLDENARSGLVVV